MRSEERSLVESYSNHDAARNTRNAVPSLAVEAQKVVQWEAEPGDGSEEIEGVVRTMPVVVVKEGREAE